MWSISLIKIHISPTGDENLHCAAICRNKVYQNSYIPDRGRKLLCISSTNNTYANQNSYIPDRGRKQVCAGLQGCMPIIKIHISPTGDENQLLTDDHR